jgi:hypothetical protein
MNTGTTCRARVLASAFVGVLTLHGQAIAQSARFDELANLPFAEGRPTRATAQTLRDELLFERATQIYLWAMHVAKRIADWGGAGLQQRMADAWASFLPKVDGWITVERSSGRDAIERVYRDTLEGRADPRRGYILSF